MSWLNRFRKDPDADRKELGDYSMVKDQSGNVVLQGNETFWPPKGGGFGSAQAGGVDCLLPDRREKQRRVIRD